MKAVFILAHHEARRRAMQAVADAPDGFGVTVAEPTRSLEQNARLWALLHEISEQVNWYGKKLTPEDWKHVFTASMRKLEVVPNIDGTGFVALGLSTSRMTRSELGDLMTMPEGGPIVLDQKCRASLAIDVERIRALFRGWMK